MRLSVPLLGFALVAAQQPPAFRSGVDVIAIDVNVVDPSHAPVTDLTAADFIVSVDYKPRKVAYANFVRYDTRAAAAGAGTPPLSVAATAGGPPRVLPPPRNVVIVIDEDSMEPGDGLLVQQEAARFIDRLAPDDRVGVLSVPRLRGELTMTKNRAHAKAALARVITGSERFRSPTFRIGLWEAFAAEDDGHVIAAIQARECRLQDVTCRIEVAMELRNIQRQEHARGERSLSALRDLGLGLETLPGPKTMILISGGAPPPEPKSNAAYARVGAAFAAAQVTLFTLLIEQPDFGQSKYRSSPTGAQDRLIDREGLENATAAAAGTFMEGIGSWGQYFDRIATEMSGSYVLGIEVESSDRNGRPHQVSVKVKRRGVDVRARAQYVIPRDK